MSAPNNPNISYTKIVIEGTRFYKPEERYGLGVQIVCDRCQATPIMEGYGFGNSDICLPCASRIIDFPEHMDNKLTFMEQQQFGEPRGGNSVGNFFTNMEQGIYWRTKMTSRMFDALEGRTPNPGRGSVDELQRRLEEMQSLRNQPIPSLSEDEGIMGYESNRVGGWTIDTQFGSLLSRQDQYYDASKIDNVIQTKPNENTVQSSTTYTPSSSRPTNMYMTRMLQGMYRTKMVSKNYK